jgi:1,4-dihydroxy-2-naphthoate octaprenyltransferase
MRGAWMCLIGAALCGIPLIVRAGWPLLVIGLTSMAAAYVYTGGPYPLAYHGLGEVFVILFFGLIACGATFYIQTLRLTRDALLAGLAAGSLATVLIVINNLRDADSDRRSNKRTLAAQLGETFARAEVVVFAVAPFAAVVFITRLPLLVLPLALLVILCAVRGRGGQLNGCLVKAAALQWAFGILFVVGCLSGFLATR